MQIFVFDKYVFLLKNDESGLNEQAKTIEKNSSGGNSATYRLTMQDGRILKLKIYPVDSKHDRLASEFMATKYLSNINDNYVNENSANMIIAGI